MRTKIKSHVSGVNNVNYKVKRKADMIDKIFNKDIKLEKIKKDIDNCINSNRAECDIDIGEDIYIVIDNRKKQYVMDSAEEFWGKWLIDYIEAIIRVIIAGVYLEKKGYKYELSGSMLDILEMLKKFFIS